MIPRYQSPEIGQIFSEEERFRIFIDIEALVLEGLAKKLSISRGEIARLRGLREKIDLDFIRREEDKTRHEITAFLNWIWARLPRDSGIQNYLHLGLTSSDLMDTALSLQMVRGLDLVHAGLRENVRLLDGLARRYQNTPVMGRTHGIHAELTSFGHKFLGYYAEGLRHLRRLGLARQEIAVGKLSGSVGNFASSLITPKVEAKLLKRLGLGPEPAATQIIARDRHGVVLAQLALMGSWVERLATEIRHSQRTEVGEMAEPFSRHQQGSSSMPHKKNPVLSENLCGLARLLRSYALGGFENVALWHERDISHSSVERVAIPDSFHVAHFMMKRLKEVLKGIQIDEAKAKANAALLRDMTASQAYLNALIQAGVSRKEAYRLIQSASFRAIENGTLLCRELMKEPGLPNGFRAQEIPPAYYLRHLGALFRRVRP